MRHSWKLSALILPVAGVLSACSVDVDEGFDTTEQSLDTAGLEFEVNLQAVSGALDGAKAKLPVYTELELVPHTISYMAAEPGVQLALDSNAAFAERISVSTGGKSTCVKLFVRRDKLAAPVAVEFAILEKGDLDPCTGAAVPPGAIDFGVEETEDDTCWRPVVRCDPKPCHWVRLTVHRSRGIR